MDSLLISFLERKALRLHDLNFRPLGEKVYPELFDKVVTKELTCPYEDSRLNHRKLMNVSALNDIAKSWRTIIYFFIKVRNTLGDRNICDMGPYNNFWRAWVVATYLPEYLYLRSELGVKDGEMPIFAAGVYKVSVGFINSTMALAMKELLGDELPELNERNIYMHADSAGELIARDGAYKGGVCAGPPNLIMEAAKSMIDSEAPFDSKLESELSDFIGDFDRYIDFGLSAFQLSISTLLYAADLEKGVLSLRQNLVDNSELMEKVDEYEQKKAGALISQTAVVLITEAGNIAQISEEKYNHIKTKLFYSSGFRNGIEVDDRYYRLDLIESFESFFKYCEAVDAQYIELISASYNSLINNLGYNVQSDARVDIEMIKQFYGTLPHLHFIEAIGNPITA